MSRFFTLLFLTLGLNACSTMKSMDFMDREEVAAFRGTDSIDEMRYKDYNAPRKVRTLGMLKVNNFDEVSVNENDPTLVSFKREKSRVYAETKLFESDNKNKTFFDESIFNLGMDKKDKGINMEWKLKF